MKRFLKYLYYKVLPVKLFLSYRFFKETQRRMRWFNPGTFSEKMQILKTIQNDPDYTNMVCKYNSKAWISERVGSEFAVPTHNVFDCTEDIHEEGLIYPCILKTTHDSRSWIILRDKSEFDQNKLVEFFAFSLSRNYYWKSKEYPYKNVVPRLICEPLLMTFNGKVPDDIKIACFNGEPEFIYVSHDREGINKRGIYDVKWNYLDACWNRIYDSCEQKKITAPLSPPKALSQMVEVAKVLSKDMRFLRVDFYEISDEKFYVGELTFYHGSGFDQLKPAIFEKYYGALLRMN